MKKNNVLLASKISEMPHHFFRVEKTTPAAKSPVILSTELSERKSRFKKSPPATQARNSFNTDDYLKSEKSSVVGDVALNKSADSNLEMTFMGSNQKS